MYLEKLLENSMPVPECGCSIWLGGVSDKRYGVFTNEEGKVERVHRRVFSEKNNTTLTQDDFVCHTCDVTLCVEPSHLFLGDAQSNMTDKVTKERQARNFGQRNGATKLTTEDVAFILRSDLSQQKVADLLGVSQTQVGRVRRGIRSGRTRQ